MNVPLDILRLSGVRHRPMTPMALLRPVVRAQGLVDVGAEVADFGPGQVPALDVLSSAEEHGAF